MVRSRKHHKRTHKKLQKGGGLWDKFKGLFDNESESDVTPTFTSDDDLPWYKKIAKKVKDAVVPPPDFMPITPTGAAPKPPIPAPQQPQQPQPYQAPPAQPQALPRPFIPGQPAQTTSYSPPAAPIPRPPINIDVEEEEFKQQYHGGKRNNKSKKNKKTKKSH